MNAKYRSLLVDALENSAVFSSIFSINQGVFAFGPVADLMYGIRPIVKKGGGEIWFDFWHIFTVVSEKEKYRDNLIENIEQKRLFSVLRSADEIGSLDLSIRDCHFDQKFVNYIQNQIMLCSKDGQQALEIISSDVDHPIVWARAIHKSYFDSVITESLKIKLK